MSIPNFTADASLYKTNRVYRTLSASDSVSGDIYLADYVDKGCYAECRATCDCSKLIGAALGECKLDCITDCSNECTRSGENPARFCGGVYCLPGEQCTFNGCCPISLVCNNRCLPPGASCCGPGSCPSGTSCCDGKGCCPDGKSCVSLFGLAGCVG
jgi:hypothetical protein